MVDTGGFAQARRPYTKPTIALVEFVTNEAVFQNCKLDSRSSGPDNHSNRCRTTVYGIPAPCQEYLS